MEIKEDFCLFWFRRDLRTVDNHGLFEALRSAWPVLPLFVFDRHILDELPTKVDARVHFIHSALGEIKDKLEEKSGSLLVYHSTAEKAFEQLIQAHGKHLKAVYTNRDYEPYARARDEQIGRMCQEAGIAFHSYKDQVLFEQSEILTKQDSPYSVFTPYSRQWFDRLKEDMLTPFRSEDHLEKTLSTPPKPMPNLQEMGFAESRINFPSKQVRRDILEQYHQKRDYPAEEATSRMGVHLRFGTISVRQLAAKAIQHSKTYLNELAWREFYMMILYHHPRVVDQAFKPKYDFVEWRNKEEEFERWCEGNTGYPIVDAGMRQLNQTGYMHNRVRMIVASFLTKHLLIDWRWGERYFADQLLDYELASNNGGWQWAAGSGTDAQPYFRIFNPWSQEKKFDPEQHYIKKWVPEYGTSAYPEPMVDHKQARQRALDTYKAGLAKAESNGGN